MAILKVARLGHPVLRRKSDPVPVREIGSSPVQRLIDDMVETMREYGGVGLAAPQVHVARRIVVFEVAGEGRDRVSLTVLVNPRIVAASRETAEDWEGCLSVPDLRGRVPRRQALQVRGLDRSGKDVSMQARGFAARVIQHELDHLDGMLFLDRMQSFDTLAFLDEYAKFWSSKNKA